MNSFKNVRSFNCYLALPMKYPPVQCPPLDLLLALLPGGVLEPVGHQAAVLADVVLELLPLLHAVLGQLLRVIDLLLRRLSGGTVAAILTARHQTRLTWQCRADTIGREARFTEKVEVAGLKPARKQLKNLP